MIVRVNVVLNRTVLVDSDNNNSPIQDYVHLDDQTQPTFNKFVSPFQDDHVKRLYKVDA